MKRYKDVATQALPPGPYHSFVERDNGPWVKWDEVEPLLNELERYKTPLVDDVEFLPSDERNHKVG